MSQFLWVTRHYETFILSSSLVRNTMPPLVATHSSCYSIFLPRYEWTSKRHSVKNPKPPGFEPGQLVQRQVGCITTQQR